MLLAVPLQDWIALAVSGMGLGALVGIGEVLRRAGGWPGAYTRAFVHAGVGLFVALTPLLFQEATLIYVLAGGFVLINLAAWQRGWLPALHAVRRRSLGTTLFPLALLFALAATWSVDPRRIFALPLAFLVLAVADPLAGLVGARQPAARRYRLGQAEKSWPGSLAFFAAAFVILTGGLLWQQPKHLVDALVVALVVAGFTTAVEALCRDGWDNLFIVVAVISLLVAWAEQPEGAGGFGMAGGVGIAFGLFAFRLRFLNAAGAVAGGLLGAALVVLGGWRWMAPAFAFFFLSSLLSKLGRRRKAAAEGRAAKGSIRDAGQVFANGGVAWALLLCHVLWPGAGWYWGFLGAFAAAAADTWATELGPLAARQPRLITTGRRVPAGTSGAVSLAGTGGACLGAGSVAGAAWLVDPALLPGAAFVAIVGCGVLASLLDSLAGATLQVRYRDRMTGTTTERPPATDAGRWETLGWRWLDNDRVNGLCTLAGAGLALLCHLWFFRS